MQCRQVMIRLLRSLILLCFFLGIVLIPQQPTFALMPSRKLPQVADVVEVSPPETIQQLQIKMEQYQPQVKILSPAVGQLIKDDMVSVRFEVKDLPIFQDKTWGLGPHLHVFLDNQPYQAVYDLSQPLVFKELAPGTHTIRVVAAYPWFESFKNPGAYAQVTFHSFIQTEENNPVSNQPLLTYSQPQGSFGTEPILLDFYLSPSATSNFPKNQEKNWQVLVSINGSSFYMGDWQPLYLQGLKPGKNWVRLELMDRQGRKIDNAFNDTIRVVELREQGEDPLSRLMRGDLSVIEAGGMIDPNYKPPAIKSAPTQPTAAPLPMSVPELQEPSAKVSPKTQTQTPQVTTAPGLKQPQGFPAPDLPISPQPPITESPTVKSKVPPRKSEDVKIKNLDKIKRIEEPFQPKSLETSKVGESLEQPVPNTKTDASSSRPQKLESAQSQQGPAPVSSSKPMVEVSPLKVKASQSRTAPPSGEKDPKPLLPSPTLEDRMPASPAKLEDQRPKGTETLTPRPPMAKSVPKMQEKLKSSPASVNPKIDKEDVLEDRSKTETTIPDSSVAAPRPPQDIETSDQDQSLRLKAKARQLWDKIRSAQRNAEQPKPLPVVPWERQEPVEVKKSVKTLENKAGQPAISTPADKTPSKSPDALVKEPSSLSPAKAVKPEIPAVKPSEPSSVPLIPPRAMEKKIAPVKTVLPKGVEEKAIPQPALIKDDKSTASEVVGGEQAVSKSGEIISKSGKEKTKSVTFDPGVWYRRFRVQGKISDPKSEAVEVNSTPVFQDQSIPK